LEEGDQGLNRSKSFLTALSDQEFYSTYKCVLNMRDREFPDIHSLLKNSKHDGKIMSLIMSHVGRWLNRSITPIGHRDNNKPPLRNEFMPALRKRHGERAKEKSVTLEKDILHFVLSRLEDLTSVACRPYLVQLPEDEDEDEAYSERFVHQVWKDLLVLVRSFTGPIFQGQAVMKFNSQDMDMVVSESVCAITQAMCNVASRVSEVSENPALNHPKALSTLSAKIQPIVMAWAAEQCQEALKPNSLAETKHWSKSTIDLVSKERARFQIQANAESNSKERSTQPSIQAPPSSTLSSPEPFLTGHVNHDTDEDSEEDIIPAEKFLEANTSVTKSLQRKHRTVQQDPSFVPSRVSKSNRQQSDAMLGAVQVVTDLQKASSSKLLQPFRPLSQASRTSWRHSPAAQHSLDST
jgi:hypothetical protein